MVHYLGSGLRNYHDRPVMPYARPYWEFQVILSGPAQPLFLYGVEQGDSPALWVFPSGCVHGWTSSSGDDCEVAVFHVDGVPDLLKRACQDEPFLYTRVQPTDCRWILNAHNRLVAGLRARDRLVELQAESIIAELSEIVMRGNPDRIPTFSEEQAPQERVVEQGLAYYAEHMREAPSVADIARHCNYSVGHFRRIVEHVRGESPRAIMAAMRMERARQLLSAGGIPVSRIAEACGYSETASFSRAFAVIHGRSPQEWRERWPEVTQRSSAVRI